MTEAEELELLELEAESQQSSNQLEGIDAISGAQNDTRMPVTPMQALAPNVTSLPNDAGLGQTIAAGATDVLSTPLAALAATGTTLGTMAAGRPQSFWESLLQIRQGKNLLGEESLASKLYSDPANVPMMAAGGSLIKYGGQLAAKSPWFSRVLKYAIPGAGEGIVSATAHQAENVARGEDIDLGSGGLEVGTSAVLPGALKGGLNLAKAGLGKLAGSLTKIDESILKEFGTGFGKSAKALRNAALKQKDNVSELMNNLFDFEQFTPEKRAIESAIEVMPNISLTNTKSAINDALNNIKAPETQSAVRRTLNKLYNDVSKKTTLPDATVRTTSQMPGADIIEQLPSSKISGTRNLPGEEFYDIDPNTLMPRKTTPQLSEQFSRTVDGGTVTRPGDPIEKGFDRLVKGSNVELSELSAKEFYEFRKLLDKDLIDFTKPGAKAKDKALRKIREAMRADLASVGGEEFANNMFDLSQKLGSKDKLVNVMGIKGKVDPRDPKSMTKVHDFLKKIYDKDSPYYKETLESLDNIFETDFSKRVQKTHMARKLGPEGVPSLKPEESISGLGGIGIGATSFYNPVIGGTLAALTAARSGLSSPRIAAGALGLTDLAEKAAGPVNKYAGLPTKQALRSLTFRDLTGEE